MRFYVKHENVRAYSILKLPYRFAHAHIIVLAKEEGAGADIVSGGELYASLRAGVEPSKIVYAGVGKTVRELENAISSDILMYNEDSHMELDVLNDIAGRIKRNSKLANLLVFPRYSTNQPIGYTSQKYKKARKPPAFLL